MVVTLNRLVQEINAKAIDGTSTATTSSTESSTTSRTSTTTDTQAPTPVTISTFTNITFNDPRNNVRTERITVTYVAPAAAGFHDFAGVDVWMEVPYEANTDPLQPIGQQVVTIGWIPATVAPSGTAYASWQYPNPARHEVWRAYLGARNANISTPLSTGTGIGATPSVAMDINATNTNNVAAFSVDDGTFVSGASTVGCNFRFTLPGTGSSWIAYDWDHCEVKVTTPDMGTGDEPVTAAVFDRNTGNPGSLVQSIMYFTPLSTASSTWSFQAFSYDSHKNVIAGAPIDTAVMPGGVSGAASQPGAANWSASVIEYRNSYGKQEVKIHAVINTLADNATLYRAFMYQPATGTASSTKPADYQFVGIQQKAASGATTIEWWSEVLGTASQTWWIVVTAGNDALNYYLPDSASIAAAHSVGIHAKQDPQPATGLTIDAGYDSGQLMNGLPSGIFTFDYDLPADDQRAWADVQRRWTTSSYVAVTDWETVAGGSINDQSAHHDTIKQAYRWSWPVVDQYQQFRVRVQGISPDTEAISGTSNLHFSPGGLFQAQYVDPNTLGDLQTIDQGILITANPERGGYNLDFEDSATLLPGWSISVPVWTVATDSGIGSGHAAKCAVTGTGGSDLLNLYTIKARNGDKYTIKATSKADAGFTGTPTLRIAQYNATGTFVGGNSITLNTSTTLTEVSSAVTLSASASTAFIIINVNVVSSVGNFYVDGISMSKSIGANDIADGSIDNGHIASGVQLANVGTALPTLPNAAYPDGSIFVLRISTGPNKYKIYRNDGGTWPAGTSPNDIIAGTLAAGVIYAGDVQIDNLTAGTASFASDAVFARGGNTLTINASGIKLIGSAGFVDLTGSSVAFGKGATSYFLVGTSVTLSTNVVWGVNGFAVGILGISTNASIDAAGDATFQSVDTGFLTVSNPSQCTFGALSGTNTATLQAITTAGTNGRIVFVNGLVTSIVNPS